jgi:hypothetical protein
MRPTQVSPGGQERKRIRPDEKVPLDLNDRERELILQHTFADDGLTRRLRIVPRAGESAAYRFTLGELDDLAGYVAAEANHAKDNKLKKRLAALFNRIQTVLESYTDAE